eukprot:scaffold838_cov160-Ochromonas_danica.AAC.7
MSSNNSDPEITQLELEVDKLLEFIKPSNLANIVRSKAADFIRNVLRDKLSQQAVIVECGSTCLRTYLADSDLDLILITNNSTILHDDKQLLITIFTALCEEIYKKDSVSGYATPAQFTIRNIDFINARTKLINCLVNNIGVDITVNQATAISSLIFLEEADKLIGHDHLFKRSVLLIKCWCSSESYRHCGLPILGAKEGMLSSYALSILVLHLFNKYSKCLSHPFHALHLFFYYYCGFPWGTHFVTLTGPQPLPVTITGSNAANNSNAKGSSANGKFVHFDSKKYKHCCNRFQGILDALPHLTGMPVPSSNSRFIYRSCNIQDPVDEFNNLGISVTAHNIALINNALHSGLVQINSILQRTAAMLRGNLTNSGGFTTHSFPAGWSAPQMYTNTYPANHKRSPSVANNNNGANNNNRRHSKSFNELNNNARSNASALPSSVPSLLMSSISPEPSDSGSTETQAHLSSARTEQRASPENEVSSNSPTNSSISVDQPINATLPIMPTMSPSSIGQSYISAPVYPHPNNLSYPSPSSGLLLREFFPVSLDRYASGLRRDLWEHPLQHMRGVDSMVYHSLIQQHGGVGNETTSTSAKQSSSSNDVDPLVSDVQALIEALHFSVAKKEVAEPGDTPKEETKEEYPAMVDNSDVPVEIDRDRSTPCSTSLTNSPRSLSPSLLIEEESHFFENIPRDTVEQTIVAQNDCFEASDDHLSMSSQATTATTSSNDLIHPCSPSPLPPPATPFLNTATSKKKKRSDSSKANRKSSKVNTCRENQDVQREIVGINSDLRTRSTSTTSLCNAKDEECDFEEVNSLFALFNDQILEVKERLQKVIVWPVAICAVSSIVLAILLHNHLRLLNGSPSTAGLASTSEPSLLNNQLQSRPFNNNLERSPASRISGSTFLFESSDNRRIHIHVIDEQALPFTTVSSSSSSSSVSSMTPSAHEEEGHSRRLQTRVVTHWVQLGDSITFGDFGNGIDDESGLVLDHRSSFLQDELFLSSSSHSVSGAQYLWKKDNLSLMVSSQPFYTIDRSSLADGGHYACFRLPAGLDLDRSAHFLSEKVSAEVENSMTKVAETIVRISSKLLCLAFPCFACAE